MVDFDLIKKLIKVLEDADITALSVEENGKKIEVRREKGSAQLIAPAAAPAHYAPQQATSQVSSKPEASEDDGIIAVTSPMVGTFYRAPSPESPGYVEIGDMVATGKVVCIIEAMKLFNEIESEVSGKLVKVLVENGQPVEYGQKLMLLKKD
jgi:acetyl-CoA carboxylase biotin carboxyl carrier protein